MRRSGEIVHDSARSPTSLVPVRSVGSTSISVLYGGAPGCSIAKVSSWWASKLGGSAATTKSSSPPRRGVSWATADVTSSETRASAVRNVFMVGIILAPMKTIVALPGEGIGVEVVEATCALLSGAGVPVKIVTPPQISAPGSPVPEDTQRACREADAVLFGAAGPATTRVVGWLRWEMDAWAGVRPAKFYPGMRSPLADPDGIDLVVIRENSEGMYPGREGDIAELARALPTVRDRFGRGLDRYKDGRFAVKVVTRDGAARVAPSANFGDGRWAYFESVHGSAPDIAGRGIAKPTGTLLSAALMLEHLGLAAEAERLQAAVARVYRDGKALTPDQRGTATTKEMAGAVLAAYRDS